MRTAEGTHGRDRARPQPSGRTRPHPALHWAALAVACALSAQARAQADTPAADPPPPVPLVDQQDAADATWTWANTCVSNTMRDTDCARDFSEGLAAVKLAAGEDDDARWGYIDAQGRVAIGPSYAEAEPFQNGLAAAMQDGKWGYLDRQGKWAIAPRFDSATGFNAEGSALVTLDEHDVLIDRQGKVLKTFPLGTRTWGFQPGQRLAAMEGPSTALLLDTRTGKARALPDDVMALGEPQGGLLPAQSRSSRYGGEWGMLDDQGRWAVRPDVLRSREAPRRIGTHFAVLRDDTWQVVDGASGKPADEARYRGVQNVGDSLWALQRTEGGFIVVDARLQTVMQDPAEYLRLDQREGWILVQGEQGTMLVPPQGKPVTLDAGHYSIEFRNGRAWVSQTRPDATPTIAPPTPPSPPGMPPPPQAVVVPPPPMAPDAVADAVTEAPEEADAAVSPPDTEAGPAADSTEHDTARSAADAAAADAATADAAAADAAAADAAAADATAAADVAGAAPAVAADAQDADDAAVDVAGAEDWEGARVVQVYERDGRPLLSPATVNAMGAYRLWHFSAGRDADAAAAARQLPLAYLTARDYEHPPALLTLSGELVSRPEWAEIGGDDRRMPVAVRTKDGKMGAVDANGDWQIAPTFSGIEYFNADYTWAYTGRGRGDKPVLIDAHGKPVPLPARIAEDGDRLRGDVLRYRERGRKGREQWGLWSIKRNAPVGDGMYDSLQEFTGDWAAAERDGKWGVIDLNGKWVVAPTFEGGYSFNFQEGGILRVRERNDNYRLIDLRTGRSSEPFRQEPRKLGNDRWLGQRDDGSLVLVGPIGTSVQVARTQPGRHEVYGNWLHLSFDGGNGAIDARGNWRIAPEQGEFNPFFVQPEALARLYTEGHYYVVDEQGRKVLPQLGDGMPLASMKRIAFSDDERRETRVTDLQGRLVTTLAGTYAIDDDHASEGVVPYREEHGRFGLLDAAGVRIVGPYFDKLGAMKQGRAWAQRADRSGKWLGYIDTTGRYAIPPRYLEANDFAGGRALVRVPGQLQFIDTDGKPMARLLPLCGVLAVLDADGRVTWPREPLTCQRARALTTAAPANPQAAKNP